MASGFNLSSFDKAFKDRYSSDFVDNMVYGNNKLYAMLKKKEDFGGRQLVYPVLFADPQGGNPTFSAAQTNASTAISQQVQFALTRVRDYQVVTIDNETMLASKGNESAFFDTAFAAIDGTYRSAARRLQTALYRAGWGDIGTVGSVSTTVITLANKEDIVNFEVGMQIVGSTTQSASVLNAAGASVTVLSVDRSAGTVTCSATAATIAPAGSFIFTKGDRQDSATPSALKISGLEAWCPPVAPSATPFFGVDRTKDSRLGGQRFDGSLQNLEETFVDAGLLLAREGGDPDTLFVNPKNYGDLVKSLGTKVNYVDVKTSANVGFRALELYLPTGTLKVVPDRDCPVNVAWMLQSNTWDFCSLGKAPRQLPTAEGDGTVTQASDDGIEVRVGWYGNLRCKAAGWNCRIKLA